jgi:hypothetical protein
MARSVLKTAIELRLNFSENSMLPIQSAASQSLYVPFNAMSATGLPLEQFTAPGIGANGYEVTPES